MIEHVTHNGKHIKTYHIDGDRRTLIWAAASNSSLEHTARLRNISYRADHWTDDWPSPRDARDYNPRNREAEERRRTGLSDGNAA